VHPLEKLLAVRIKQIREERGWSQAQFAEACGFSDREVRHLEKGDRWPKADTLDKLACGLHLHPKDFFDFPWPSDQGDSSHHS